MEGAGEEEAYGPAGEDGVGRYVLLASAIRLTSSCSFSILETQQPFYHMNMELKRDLVDRLEATAPEYGLLELSYPSFFRCYGYRLHPLSAADAVEGLAALLDVAGGVKMEVEVEGARNGGEWFGAGRVWELHDEGREYGKRRREDERENIPPGGPDAAAKKANGEEEDQYDAMGNKIDTKKKKKLTASEARKAKKDRMARRKRGEEVFTDDEL